jgi:hypothetical protein
LAGFRVLPAKSRLCHCANGLWPSNQVAFWHALRLSGTHAAVTGYGELFTRELPAS